MNDLEDRVLQLVRREPGHRADEIAAQLDADRRGVVTALYGSLREHVRQDRTYRWFPKETFTPDLRRSRLESPEASPLSRLCRYYLECLSHDDLGEVSAFAESRDPTYVELPSLPMLGGGCDPLRAAGAHALVAQSSRRDKPKALYVGYPTHLKKVRSRKGWEGFFVEPVLLFPFQEGDARPTALELSAELPMINFGALSSLTNCSDSELAHEGVRLAEDLGLGGTGSEEPHLDELLARLPHVRPEWCWLEDLDPYALSSGVPLAEQTTPGILNRAVLIAADRSLYTRGLETELARLQSLAHSPGEECSLTQWLDGGPCATAPDTDAPLLEVLPLNTEQRQAVQQALRNRLTVITGPPGTGKSQVVSSILLNAVFRGQSVLFSSKNNKAVDVVETRTNALGPRPVLVRLGARQHQARLAEFLIGLLAASCTPEDHALYSEHDQAHQELVRRCADVDRAADELVELRNRVDALDQETEELRGELGEELFRGLGEIDVQKATPAAETLQRAVAATNHGKQSLLTRLFWPLLRHSRYTALACAASSFAAHAEALKLPPPACEPRRDTLGEWGAYARALSRRVVEAQSISGYFTALDKLTRLPPLEQLSRERRDLGTQLAANSEGLWQAWLRLQPARLTSEQRRLLSSYSGTIELVVAASQAGQDLGLDLARRYQQLFEKVTAMLPCWGVTSLSVRNRLPLKPGVVDLLVIDEASQCDIASALPLLYRARRVVVIGDPMQLRHVSTLSRQQDAQLLAKHGLMDTHTSWAYSTRSLFDLAAGLARGEDIVSLRDHHRSHADIIGFSNREFYEGRLRTATRYDRLRRPAGEPAVRWLQVSGTTTRPPNGGAANAEEARAVVAELDRLISQGYDGTIGVVSPFRAQAQCIRELVEARPGLAKGLAEHEFLVDTVHRFQGDERDVMVFSPTLGNGVSEGALAFLRHNPNLFNVAITRARAALVVVGDATAAMASGVEYLARFAAYVEQVSRQRPQPQALDPTSPAASYPQVTHPEHVSPWEKQLHTALTKAGFCPFVQYEVEQYLLDFAILRGDRRLDVEVDGERYHRAWNGELRRRDEMRNQRLMELGWDVMRFWVYQVRDDVEGCVRRVQEWVDGGLWPNGRSASPRVPRPSQERTR